MVFHPYHLVDPSPWPYIGACFALLITIGSVIYFHYSKIEVLFMGVMGLSLTMIIWWRDVIREVTFQGLHTIIVKQGLKYGMLLFILSEVLFFFSFFWAFFHSSLALYFHSSKIEVLGAPVLIIGVIVLGRVRTIWCELRRWTRKP